MFCNFLKFRKEISWRRQLALSDTTVRPLSYLWLSGDQVFHNFWYNCLLEIKTHSFWAPIKMGADFFFFLPWLDLEIVILSEESQTKEKYCMTSLTIRT